MAPIDLHDGPDDPDDEKPPKRGPGRPKKAESLGDLEKDMREQLDELGEWIRKRDPDFAATFLEDVPRMAKFLSTRAGKHARLAHLLKIVFAKDGPLAGLRAFGRTTRAIAGRLNARRAEAEPDHDLYVDEDGNTRDRHGNIVVPGT
jgi:hypothetical protein